MSTTLTFTTVLDALVSSAVPNRNFGDAASFPISAPTTFAGFVAVPFAVQPDQEIVSATLRGYASVNADTPIEVRAVADDWDPGDLTFNNQPGVRPGPVVTTIPATALLVFDPVALDVTSLVKAIAAGAADYGFRIARSGSTAVNGTFELSETVQRDQVWTLEVVTADRPSPPSAVSPNGGEITDQTWVCEMDYSDLGGDSELGAVQVQVDPNQSTTAPAFDSGVVADVDYPALDLADPTPGGTYPGLADGATTYWRGQTISADGIESGWGDWAQVTRSANPSFTIDNPTPGIMRTAKPVIRGHVGEGGIEAYRVWVFGEDGKERYDSGRKPNKEPDRSTFAHQVPFRKPGFYAYDEQGHMVSPARIVFPDDGDYKIRVRVWRAGKKQWGGPNDPPYLQRTIEVIFNPSASLTPPVLLTAVPSDDGPGVDLTWNLADGAGVPDSFVLKRNGIRITDLELPPIDGTGAADDPLVYAYTDRGARPNTVNTYTVRTAIASADGPEESDDSPEVSSTNDLNGLWLVSRHGNVVIDEPDVTGLKYRDKRTTIETPYRPDDIDITTAQTGLEGPVTGVLTSFYGDDVDTLRDILRKIRRDTSYPAYLVYGTVAAPVSVRDQSTTPSATYEHNRQHDVSLSVKQVDEFEQFG